MPKKNDGAESFFALKNDGAESFFALENDGAGTFFDTEKYPLPGVCSGKFCPLPKMTAVFSRKKLWS